MGSFEGLIRFGSAVCNLPSFPAFCAYLLLIAFSGWWQKLSQPLSLRPVLILYNFLCCGISMYNLAGFAFTILSYHSLFDKSPSRLLMPIFYMYWISKCVELLDTGFMILRHKRRQISFLHVYHHGSMLLLSDYAYRHAPWPTIGVFLGLNSFVHVLLYGYYGLTALRPDDPPSWKRRLTEIQIAQFLLGLCVAVPGYLYHGFCIYGIFYGLIMTALFTNFYYHAYIRKKPAPSRVSNGKKHL